MVIPDELNMLSTGTEVALIDNIILATFEIYG